MTSITTNLIIEVFRFSNLHWHRGQNSRSFPLILSAIRGIMTFSQSLLIVECFQNKANKIYNFTPTI